MNTPINLTGGNGPRWALTVALNQALAQAGYLGLAYDQLECLADEEREPEARGMVQDIIDRVLAGHIDAARAGHLYALLDAAIPIDPDDPDEGTTAYGGWDHDVSPEDAQALKNRTMRARLDRITVPEDGPSHPCFVALTTGTVKCDPWQVPLVRELDTWIACNGFTKEDGDAGDILALGKTTEAQAEWLRNFQFRWEIAESHDELNRHIEVLGKGERRAQAHWLDKMGMGPVAVHS